MAAPAIKAAIDAVLAKVEAITPTIEPGRPFRRKSETAPPTTRAAKRLFDFDFRGLDNVPGATQNPDLTDRQASIALRIDYPVGNSEKALETTLAVDSELVLRALGKSANWSGTPIRRVAARAEVERVPPPDGQGAATFSIVVNADVFYRDSEA